MKETILVRGVNWIGDAVMTLPALKGLRKAYPDAQVSLLVKPFVAAVFEKNPAIDEIILYEKEFEGIIGKLKLAGKLRKSGFSKAILFQNAFDAAFIAYLSGIPERIGYDRDGRGRLLTSPVRFDNDDRKVHHVEYYLNLLRASGVPAEYSRPWIFLSFEERLAARKKMECLRRPVLGINPGAAYGSAKRWLPDRFAEVANWFITDTGGSVVMFGGDNEIEVTQEIEFLVRRKSGEPSTHFSHGGEEREGDGFSVLNLAGKTSLRELISLISGCDVFLSNDSGPMHVAYSVGTPLVALFGSTSPELTGPASGGSAVVRPDTGCSPCFERTCKDKEMRCMYDITSDDVYLAIKRLLPREPAVFFDRDGTLCEDVEYLSRREDFRLLPGVEDLVRLKDRGYRLIGVTNQSGIARGLVEERFVREINDLFVTLFGFDDFFFCPHHPDEHCGCRKPEPQMLCEARYEHGIDLGKSFVVGDKDSDMIMAKSAGAGAILVGTGKQSDSPVADFVANGLKEAVDFILEKGMRKGK
jgi:heptosyltransferase-2